MEKTRRMNRIFRKNGKALIVAMDHGTFNGAAPGLEQPGKVIEQMVEGGADGILANIGMARFFAKELSGTGLIARLDLPPTILGQGHDSRLVYSADLALNMGADAVIVNGGMGVGVEETTFPNIAEVVELCSTNGLPVVGEMVPGGFDADKSFRTLDNLRMGARIACEMGVDFIKSPYLPGFEKVVGECFCPLVVLGGARTDNQVEFLSSIKDAMNSGAAGVAIGRNIWGAPDPLKMTQALCAIIHGDAEVEEAAEILK